MPHRIPWHWQVPAYLVTKAIGAGMLLLAATAVNAEPLLLETPLLGKAAPLIALAMALLTTVLLILDLDRPSRFWKILARPQWRSWLTRGAVVLMAFSAVSALLWLADATDNLTLGRAMAWPAILLSVLAASYTAFLFAQAEGRDLWQSPLLPWHLLVQAVMAGSAGLIIAEPFFEEFVMTPVFLKFVFGASLLVNLLITAFGEFGLPHASIVASAAARMITRGRYAPHYWGSIIGGLMVPLAIVIFASDSPVALAAAGALALGGLFSYEWAFVFAPQQVPNS